MVDADKIEDRLNKDGGEEQTENKQKSKRKKKGGERKKKDGSSGSSGGGIDHSKAAKSDTKSEKMEKFKKAKGSSSKKKGKGSSGSGIPRRDAGEVLECLGNIVLYSEGMLRSREDPDSEKESVQGNIAGVVYDQYTEIISKHDVQAICEKYAVDWQSDVLENILENQDFSTKVENFGKKDSGEINMGKGNDFDKKDYHELLLATGEMFLFTEMVQDRVEEQGGRKKAMAEGMVDDMVSECIDFLGVFNVQENAEDNGISWERDVLAKISQG